jgi:hypothetical protein
MSLYRQLILDLEALESAKLDFDKHLTASTALATLHFLRRVSQLLGKPMDAISAADVISQFNQEKPQSPLEADSL